MVRVIYNVWVDQLDVPPRTVSLSGPPESTVGRRPHSGERPEDAMLTVCARGLVVSRDSLYVTSVYRSSSGRPGAVMSRR